MLLCIREFVLLLDATVEGGAATLREFDELARAYRRLPANVQALAAGYRQCLAIGRNGDGHRAQAARHQVLANLIRGTGLTREQFLASPVGPGTGLGDRDAATDTDAATVAAHRRVAGRRSDSDGDFWPVAVAAAVPAPERSRGSRRARRGQPLPKRRGRYAAAAAAAVAVICLGVLSLSWLAGPTDEADPPEPAPARDVFSINRVIEFDGGIVIFSHGERVGDITRLYTYQINDSDEVQPAAQPAASADVTADDDTDDDDDARPITDITGEPDPVVPPKSIRRQVLEVDTRSGAARITLDKDSVKSVRIGPLLQ